MCLVVGMSPQIESLVLFHGSFRLAAAKAILIAVISGFFLLGSTSILGLTLSADIEVGLFGSAWRVVFPVTPIF